MLNIRDELTTQPLGWRQIIRDMPEEQLPAVKVIFAHVEKELIALATKAKK